MLDFLDICLAAGNCQMSWALEGDLTVPLIVICGSRLSVRGSTSQKRTPAIFSQLKMPDLLAIWRVYDKFVVSRTEAGKPPCSA